MKRLRLALGLLAAVTCSAIGASGQERRASHTFACSEVQVPMRDGTKLATDLYLPKGEGPFPVIIERTPYGKRECENPHAPYFAERGYAVLIQDVRGRYRSPGIFAQFADEGWGTRQDGYDTIEWAGTQPWSTGNVGTIGLSYSCFNQNLTVVTQPPHLKAMFCSDSASNWYKDHRYPGGAFHTIGANWFLNQNDAAKPLLENKPGERATSEDWLEWHRRRVQAGMGFWESWQNPMMAAQMGHTTYDEFWRQLAADEHIEKITIPVYYTSGWYDRYPHVVTDMFNAVRTRGGSELARRSVKLMIGPWTHGGSRSGQRVVGDADFGEAASINYAALQVRWFDQHLRSLDTGIMNEPPVRIFVMGINEWRAENEWPLARAVDRKFYLRPTRSGSIDSLNDGTLSTQAPTVNEKPATFTFDPKDPVLSIGGDLFSAPVGVRDHRPADRRSLTFTTAPLTEDTEVSGPSQVELYASSSADDTDFVVTLIDVHPNGYSQILRQNILRASRRESLENPTPIEPGEVYKLTIPIFPISNVFKQGHRIRLTVSSSSFPKWMPNHNKFMLDNEKAPFVVAQNTVYLDAKRASVLTLPVVPSPQTSTK